MGCNQFLLEGALFTFWAAAPRFRWAVPAPCGAVLARGFSLIEMLVVMTILAILLGIGVPNMAQYFASNRLNGASSDLFAMLNLARSEAMRRGQMISMRHNGTAGSRDWNSGWSMFVDADGDGVLDAGEEVVRQGAASTGTVTMFSSAAFATAITFDGGGRLVGGNGGVFVICDGPNLVVNGEARSRALLVNPSGRVRLAIDSDNDKVPETDTAAIASCTNP